MTKTTSIVLCFACFIANIYAQYSGTGDYESCNTPKRELGQCITIRQCPDLLHLLDRRPLSAKNADYLKRSQCGFEGLDPIVCCPLKSDTGVTQPTVPDSKHPSKDEGTKHESVTSDILPSTEICGIFTQDRIFGGEATSLDEFPWMALIEYQKPNGRGFYCGGVLISDQYVLTAAHCVKGQDIPRDWRVSGVRLGEYNTDAAIDCTNFTDPTRNYCAEEPVNVPVVKQIAHEDYIPSDLSQHHDIALLRLARKVSFTDYVKPICVPTTSEQLNSKYVGTNMTVAGWGKTETRSESNLKLKLEVPVKSNSECSSVYSNARVNLAAGQLCAGGLKGKDSCRGDSGGPLMGIDVSPAGLTWYVTGIVSFGPSPCGLEGWPGVYTRVSEYVPWIVSHLEP